jgi:arylsulfatase A-like enzyme
MRSPLLSFALLSSALLGCAPERRADAPPNVVLLVLDTVRADHLGCYGYARPTSPAIDAFAASATRYTRSLSSAPWTVPTHASLFTGKAPVAHGAHTIRIEERGKPDVRPLGLDELTLAEVFAEEGYETAAFAANTGFLARQWQLDQGFQTYHLERSRADVLNRKVFEWLDQRGSEPFFLFVNYIDAHRPYDARPRRGFLDPPASQDPHLLDRLAEAVMPGTGPIPERLAAQVIDQYDTAIANLDEQVGVLLRHLEERGLAEHTVVVITSDHGEYFGEHHLVEHSKDIYESAIRIPLLIRAPGQRAAAIDNTPVISYDFPRLLLALFPAGFQAKWRSAFPEEPGRHPVVAESYYARQLDVFHPVWGWRFRRIRRALVEWPYKLIHSSDGQHELYDIVADPAEAQNLIDEQQEIAQRMHAVLAEFVRQREPTGPAAELQPLDADLEEQLRSLGYTGK